LFAAIAAVGAFSVWVGIAKPSKFEFTLALVCRGAGLWLLFSTLIAWYRSVRETRLKSGRVVRGSMLSTVNAFNRRVQGSGIGLPCVEPPSRFRRRGASSPKLLRIPKSFEPRHILICGDSGTGKTVTFHHFLHQIKSRPGEIVGKFDPSLQFWTHHGEDGDVLLHPDSEECPYYDLLDEIEKPSDAVAIAKSFIPPQNEFAEDFWETAPQRLLEFLLLQLKQQGRGLADLWQWLQDEDELTSLVKGTALAPLIDPNAAAQRVGVLASMNKQLLPLMLLPPDDGRPHFSFRRWAKERRHWVFIGSSGPRERVAFRPLISAWLDIMCGTLMSGLSNLPAWVFIDELRALNRLPMIGQALIEGRKYNLRVVIGFQGRSQLEQCYGKEAEALMSSPKTRIILGTQEYEAAKWAAQNMGMPEFEREIPSHSYHLTGESRDSLSTRTELRSDYLVLPNEVQNLPDLQGFFCHQGRVVKVQVAYPKLEQKKTVSPRLYLP
jgi:type IV secretory pathway TraG/TraD family ATPase VirD4